MSDKEASQVLTSDNSAEFYANRLGLADKPVETEAVETEPVAEETQSEPEKYITIYTNSYNSYIL